MKKKYLLLFLTFAIVFLSAVGSALWVILDEEVEGPKKYTKLNINEVDQTLLEITLPTAAPFYYGADDVSLTDGLVEYMGQEIKGTWSVKNTKLSKSSGSVTQAAVSGSNMIEVTDVEVVFTPSEVVGALFQSVSSNPRTLTTASMYAVAYVASSGDSTTGTYYTDITSAIKDANEDEGNNKHVFVCETSYMYRSNVTGAALGALDSDQLDNYKNLPALTISDELTINSGVTLYMPNSGTTIMTATGGPTTTTTGSNSSSTTLEVYGNPEKYLRFNVSIAQGVNLINQGTIKIGGVISGGNGGNKPNSVTSREIGNDTCNYGQITMFSNASLTNNGTIDCYGFIDEYRGENYNGSVGNGSVVLNQSGSKFTMPFSVIEHRGGNAFGSIYNNYKGAAFNRFYMSNVTSEMQFDYNSTLTGYANLYASEKINETNIALLGNSKSYLIYLKDSNSQFIIKYNPIRQAKDSDNGQTKSKWIFKGNIEVNSLSLSINTGFAGTVTIDTKDVYFPFSWYHQVFLEKAKDNSNSTVIFNQDVKFLPGSSLNVAKGVTLNATKIAVYQSFVDNYTDKDGSSVGLRYESGLPEAVLTVNGTLNCESLGGKVQTSDSGAVLNVSKESSLVSYEVLKGATAIALLGTATWTPINLTLNMMMKGNDEFSDQTTGVYHSVNSDGGVRWIKEFAVEFNANGGAFSNGTTTKIINAKDSVNVSDQEKPTRAHYHFTHWCTNASCTNGADCATKQEGVINADAALYAIWKENVYTLYRQDVVDGEISGDPITITNFTINTDAIALEKPNLDNYTFNYWRVDTNEDSAIIQSINMAEYLNKAFANGGETGSVTIYAHWVAFDVYTIYFNTTIDNGDTNYSYVSVSVVNRPDATLDAPTASTSGKEYGSQDNDITYQYAWGGWYIDQDLTIPYANWAQLRDDAKPDGEENFVRTLYAKWIKKHELSFETSYPDETTSIDAISNVYLLSGQSHDISQYNGKVTANDSNTEIKYYFGSWCQNSVDGEVYADSTVVFVEDSQDLTLYVKWESKATITRDYKGKTDEVHLKAGSKYVLEDPAPSEGVNVYYYLVNDTRYDTEEEITVESDISIIIKYKVTINITESVSNSNFQFEIQFTNPDGSSGVTVKQDSSNYQVSQSGNTTKYQLKDIPEGSTFKFIDKDPYNSDYRTVDSSNKDFGEVIEVGYKNMEISFSGGCVFGDTQVLMADGSTKLVRDIKLGDMIKSWSFETGKFEIRPVVFIEEIIDVQTEKLTLRFDDGTTLSVAWRQSFFDMDKRNYFVIDCQNVAQYVGTRIMAHKDGKLSAKKIVGYDITVVTGDIYELITAYDYNFFANDVMTVEPYLLCIPPFEIDSNYRYDQAKMQEDIEKYGLYTYEDFSHIATREQFELLNAKYFKVAVGKGYYTYEYILEIAAIFLNEQTRV